jgi:hypothetical protein
MCLATLFAAPALGGGRLERRIRVLFLANAVLVVPIVLTCFVSRKFLYVGALWAVTIPGSSALLAVLFQGHAQARALERAIARIARGRRSGARTAGRVALAVAIAAALYLVVYRPIQLRWGATSEEVTRWLPGDEIQPHPIFDATRAITIDRPPREVWPWLVQIGYHRAGWYSALDWADNGGVPSADRIVPELQRLAVGDVLPVAARGDPLPFVPEISWRVVALEPDRLLLAASPSGRDSWVWILEPRGEQQTRLLWRMRNASYDWGSAFLGLQLATDLGDFVFVRNILLSMKERAEGRPLGSLAAGTTMVLLWLVVFGAFLCTLVMLALRRDWLRPLLAVAATCAICLSLVFGMPPLWVDVLAALAVPAGLWSLYTTGAAAGGGSPCRSSPLASRSPRT